MKLTVALDIRHPFAYLALGPTIELRRETGVEIDWLPVRTQPLRTPSVPAPDDDRGVRHKRHRAEMIAREIAVYADAQGLRIESPYRDGPTAALHSAWLWIRVHAPDVLETFLERAFARYWALDLDPHSLDEVVTLAGGCGLDEGAIRAWTAGKGKDADDRIAAELAEAGVFQTPAYLLGDEVFYGRQHLPMIRWLLEGRRGPAPI
ncbi:MAG: DsbA family protein [Myxococcales bacterium]|nr:DsbA family protein [Myxococcales bacterium]